MCDSCCSDSDSEIEIQIDSDTDSECPNSPEIVFIPDWDLVKGKINLGLVCINTILRKDNIFSSRTMIRKNFSVESAQKKSSQNLLDIIPMLNWNVENNIKCFRLSSDIFPHFTDSETEPYTIDFADPIFEKVSKVVSTSKIRLLMHPGQYNNVGCKSVDIFDKTSQDLAHHADILNKLKVDLNGVLIVHGGGTYGDKEATKRRWIEQFDDLPKKVKERLVIENCEKSYNVRDCLDIAQECKIPVVFDCHHYECYDICHPKETKYEIEEFMPEIIETWKDRRIVMHVSQQAMLPNGKSQRLGKHSDYITKIPLYMFNIVEDYDISYDLEVEAKMKEQAIFKIKEIYPGIFV